MMGMKVRLLLTISLSALSLACAHPRLTGSESPAPATSAKSTASAPVPIAAHRVDFAAQVQPILETHCQPCHFEGGQMYERLPFDRGETIVGLGEKLFTRIKDEGEQGVIREFLAQEASASGR